MYSGSSTNISHSYCTLNFALEDLGRKRMKDTTVHWDTPLANYLFTVVVLFTDQPWCCHKPQKSQQWMYVGFLQHHYPPQLAGFWTKTFLPFWNAHREQRDICANRLLFFFTVTWIHDIYSKHSCYIVSAIEEKKYRGKKSFRRIFLLFLHLIIYWARSLININQYRLNWIK